MFRAHQLIAVIALAVLALPAALTPLVPPAAAAGPDLIHYQGYLTDDNGTPVTTPVTLEFRIYAALSGGTPLWTENHGSVAPDAGVFNVVLGSVTAFPASLFSSSSRWLETVVDGNPLVPRRQFLSVPYALRATIADSAISGGGGNDDWQVSGNDIYRLNGNVAIGSTSATSHLTVSRDNQAPDHQLEIRNVGSIQQPSYDGIVFTQGANGETLLGSIQLDYRNNGRPDLGISLRDQPNLMYMKASGSIGIGTTAPDARLHVQRDTFSSQTLVQIEDNNSSNNALTVQKTVGDGSAATFSITDAPSNPNAAIYALTTGAGQAGVFQINNVSSTSPVIETLRSPGGLHARFNGNVQVTGNLTKGSGTFKIDHPLAPERKYLSHSFVESPDMMNIYNGNSTCDAKGEVVVELPAWFEALNGDYRYQLTSIGEAAPLYVAAEVADNRFRIAGGRSGLKVSWQVTGVRKDAYAMANRVRVEEEKPAELIGYYLHPEAFGLPAEQGIAAVQAAAQGVVPGASAATEEETAVAAAR